MWAIRERHIYQHTGCHCKFKKCWGPWLDTPGLRPSECSYEIIAMSRETIEMKVLVMLYTGY